jgi:hypothetical protein
MKDPPGATEPKPKHSWLVSNKPHLNSTSKKKSIENDTNQCGTLGFQAH